MFKRYIDSVEIDGLVQERRNSIANALELCLSFTNPSKWDLTVLNVILCWQESEPSNEKKEKTPSESEESEDYGKDVVSSA